MMEGYIKRLEENGIFYFELKMKLSKCLVLFISDKGNLLHTPLEKEYIKQLINELQSIHDKMVD